MSAEWKSGRFWESGPSAALKRGLGCSGSHTATLMPGAGGGASHRGGIEQRSQVARHDAEMCHNMLQHSPGEVMEHDGSHKWSC